MKLVDPAVGELGKEETQKTGLRLRILTEQAQLNHLRAHTHLYFL